MNIPLVVIQSLFSFSATYGHNVEEWMVEKKYPERIPKFAKDLEVDEHTGSLG